MKSSKQVVAKGYIQLKRQRFWVLRYAILYSDRLIYSESENTEEVRAEFKLKDVEIKEERENEKKCIIITRKSNGEVLCIQSNEHDRWLRRLTDTQKKLYQVPDDKPQLPTLQQKESSIIIDAQEEEEQQQVQFFSEIKQDRYINVRKSEIIVKSSKEAFNLESGDFIVDSEFVKDQKASGELLKRVREASAAQESDWKCLVAFDHNFQVIQLGKEQEVKPNLSYYLEEFIHLMKTFVMEDSKRKGAVWGFIWFFYFCGYMAPYYLTLIAFIILFVIGRKWKFSKNSESNYAFEISGYFKFNINEFLKYLSTSFSKNQSTNKPCSLNLKSNKQLIEYQQQYQLINTIFERDQVIIHFQDKKSSSHLVIFCTLSIIDQGGFNISVVTQGRGDKSYIKVVKFLEGCVMQLKAMRNNENSELFAYCERNKHSLFIGMEILSNFSFHKPVVLGQKDESNGENRNTNVSNTYKDKQFNSEISMKSIKNQETCVDQIFEQQEQQQQQQQQQLFQDTNSQKEYEKYQAEIDQLANQLMKLSELNQENNWESCGGDNHIQVHKKFDNEKNLVYCRGESKIPCNMIELKDFLMNVESQREFNSYYYHGEVVKKYNDSLQIIYSITKKILIIDPRDVLGIQGLVQISNKKLLICCKSIYDQERVPLMPNAVRVDLVLGGFLLEELSEGVTNCIYLICSDPKGKIPDFVKNTAMKEQAKTPNLIRKLYEAKLKK